jgi:hypothetical protein
MSRGGVDSNEVGSPVRRGDVPVDVKTDIRQIAGRFEARIALLTGSGNGKSPPPQAEGHRSWWLTAARRSNTPLCSYTRIWATRKKGRPPSAFAIPGG